MATRSASFKSSLSCTNNENHLVSGKSKLITGNNVHRHVLGEIGNKARLLQRSASESTKTSSTAGTFKHPAHKQRPVKKATQHATKQRAAAAPVQEQVQTINNSVVEKTMHSLPPSPNTTSEDMSIVEEVVSLTQCDKLPALEEEQPSPCAEEKATELDQEVEDLTTAFSSNLINVIDIDADDTDPQLVSEYANEIYLYMRHLENLHKVQRRYLEGRVVTGRMRAILVDWLVQVHQRFNLMQETLYLTISILDRYLQLKPDTPKNELQLVGITAMFVAAKYEEMWASEIADFVYITDKSYTKQQIRQMEVAMLKTLHFYISFPLPLHFLRRNSKAGQVNGTQHTLAKYLMELCLPDYNMCHYKASEIGGAALLLTMKLIGPQPEWTDTLTYYSGYSEAELMPIVCKMAQVITRSHSSKQQAIPTKYRSNRYLKISELPELRAPLIRSLAEKALTST